MVEPEKSKNEAGEFVYYVRIVMSALLIPYCEVLLIDSDY